MIPSQYVPAVSASSAPCGAPYTQCHAVSPAAPGFWQWMSNTVQYQDNDPSNTATYAPGTGNAHLVGYGVKVDDYAPGSHAVTVYERKENCVTTQDVCVTAASAAHWIYGSAMVPASYYGGAAGLKGAAGAAGAAGTGGAGGTGDQGATGAEGSVFLITDTTSVPGGMVVGNYTKTIVNT